MTNELSSIEMFRKDFINNFSHEFRTASKLHIAASDAMGKEGY
jgi:hypothetical protein